MSGIGLRNFVTFICEVCLSCGYIGDRFHFVCIHHLGT